MAKKQFVLFRGVKSFLKPLILAVLVFALIVGFGAKLPLLANQSAEQKAAVLIADGKLLLEKGRADLALEKWESAEEIYREIGNYEGIVGSQLNQGLALEAMGFYRDSCNIIFAAFSRKVEVDKCDELDEDNIEAVIKAILANPKIFNGMAFENLVNRLRLLGKWKALEQVLELDSIVPKEKASIYLTLGNVAKDLAALARVRGVIEGVSKRKEEAINYYEKAIALANSQLIGLQARLNWLSLLKDFEPNESESMAVIQQEIDGQISDLFVSNDIPRRDLIYVLVNYAITLNEINNSGDVGKAIALLKESINLAKQLENKQLLSFAKGILGEIEDNQKELEEALGIALKIDAPELAYRWEWQIGKILKDRVERREEAIAYYRSAFSILKELRKNLVALNRDIQFNFRDEIEKFYLQYADLLLQAEPEEKEPKQENIREAREVIEALQLAELDDYFREACVEVKEQDLDKIVDETDPAAVVVYSILLEDRIAQIVKVTDRPLYFYETANVSKEKVKEKVKDLRYYLELGGGTTPDVNRLSQYLYRWLQIDNILELLKDNSEIKTLVFVSDIELQNIPMAVLYDSDAEEYLLQKGYALVLVPGVQLLDPEPLEITRKGQTKVFTGGVEEEQKYDGKVFERIENLKEELLAIQDFFPTNKPLLDSAFTKENLRQELESDTFSIVHIKTHGRFSSNPEDTFILAYKEPLTTNDLNNLVKSRNPEEVSTVKLLVLSACETAEGDERAALGLSGFAVRGGARSTLSTLWKAGNRENTDFMRRFYAELSKENTTRAQALHTVQLEFMQANNDTNVWSNYVLVGNWL